MQRIVPLHLSCWGCLACTVSGRAAGEKDVQVRRRVRLDARRPGSRAQLRRESDRPLLGPM